MTGPAPSRGSARQWQTPGKPPSARYEQDCMTFFKGAERLSPNPSGRDDHAHTAPMHQNRALPTRGLLIAAPTLPFIAR